MNKTVFMFSGQGSQYAGMGKELCENFTEAKRVYEEASEQFGYDVLKFSIEGSAQELAATKVSQPLIYTLSMAAFKTVINEGASFDAVAGFSLGEVSALTAAGAVTLENGFKIIGERAHAMQTAAESTNGAMFAVIGASGEAVEKSCEDACCRTKGYCAPVNYNCPSQIVIAGEEETVILAAQGLSDSGIRVVRLAVNAAFHSKLMESASASFYDKINGYPFTALNKDLYSNITGDKVIIGDVPSYLQKQMISPVRFTQEMDSMKRDGFDTFIEFGPGKTLCGFIRRGIKGASFCNVENVKGIEKCLTLLK